MELSNEDLGVLANHILLPPRLPQKDDSDSPGLDIGLLSFVREQAAAFHSIIPQKCSRAWRVVDTMLQDWLSICQNHWVSQEVLSTRLKSMREDGKLYDTVPFKLALILL